MIDPAYAAQKAVYGRVAASSVLTALVPAAAIVDDAGGLPTVFPSILIGEAQTVDAERIARDVHRVYLTWHLWTREPRLNEVKKIGGAFREAVRGPRLALDGGYHLGDLLIESIRYIRDPSGENGHGIVTINALVSET